jgi:hypothetical protein
MGPGGPPGLQNRSLPAHAGRLGSTPRRFRHHFAVSRIGRDRVLVVRVNFARKVDGDSMTFSPCDIQHQCVEHRRRICKVLQDNVGSGQTKGFHVKAAGRHRDRAST